MSEIQIGDRVRVRQSLAIHEGVVHSVVEPGVHFREVCLDVRKTHPSAEVVPLSTSNAHSRFVVRENEKKFFVAYTSTTTLVSRLETRKIETIDQISRSEVLDIEYEDAGDGVAIVTVFLDVESDDVFTRC